MVRDGTEDGVLSSAQPSISVGGMSLFVCVLVVSEELTFSTSEIWLERHLNATETFVPNSVEVCFRLGGRKSSPCLYAQSI